jgi:hypothetical protein
MEVEVAYFERTFLLVQALVDELRLAGSTNLPEQVEWQLAAAMDVAIQIGDDVPLPPAASARIVTRLTPANAKVDESLKEAHRLLMASRFWLGASTQNKLMAELTSIRTLFDHLQPNRASFEQFRHDYAAVLRKRGDAQAFLSSLVK